MNYHREDRAESLRLLVALYEALRQVVGDMLDPEFCEDNTPICSNTEAEYVREGLDHLPVEFYQATLLRSRRWLIESDGPRTKTSMDQESWQRREAGHHLRDLRHRACPFFDPNGLGACVLGNLRPLGCRLQWYPNAAREPVDGTMRRIFSTYPQRTGFLPTQLYTLLAPDDFGELVLHKQIDDAKLARGGLAAALMEVR